jgi:integrase
VTYRKPRQITPKQLLKIWLAYTAFRKPQITYSTLHRDYAKVHRVIATRLPADLTTALQIRDWLTANYAAETTRRYLQQFNAACEWAFDSDLYPSSPFAGMSRHFKVIRHDESYRAFTPDERSHIIDRFQSLHPYYTDWVKFQFWTGARPEESSALRWEHIHPSLSHITFKVAVPVETKIEQKTKTGKVRDVPTNDKLRFFLKSLQQFPYDRTAYVLPGIKGGRFEYHNFQTRYWKPLVEELVEEGLVFTYLSQYHMRHTWITLALQAGMSVADVAYLSGNSAAVIWKYYASRTTIAQLPDF